MAAQEVLYPRLFVANSRSNAITVYDPKAAGDQQPLRMIFGPLTELETPGCLATDTRELWVGNANSVAVFGLNDDGNLRPRRLIKGSQTGLSLVRGLALRGEELIVACANPDSIRVFPARANGNIQPLRSLAGAHTALNGPQALIFQENLLWVANEGGNQLLGFRPESSGNAYPERIITRESFRTYNPRGLAMNENQLMYLTGDGGLLEVLRGSHLERRLHSSELIGSCGVVCHADEVFVANSSANTTVVFGQQGNEVVRVLRGPRTRLRGPSGLVVAPCR